jgi:hypothetical protein
MAQLSPPILCAIATDKVLKPTHSFPDTANLPSGASPMYGQDLTFGTSGAGRRKHNVGSTVADLTPKMNKLLSVFASNDKSGMAGRLFKEFLAPQKSVKFFDDADMSKAASQHSNIVFFTHAALSAPNSPHQSAGKTRIHQALKNAGWDIAKLKAPADLGVPAFNKGNKWPASEDFTTGLGLMINGVQHAFVVATQYAYDRRGGTYDISLRYLFYDVFGLDDDDLDEYGAESDGTLTPAAEVGITAWWQLQHQHSHAPLVTRIILEKDFKGIPAT